MNWLAVIAALLAIVRAIAEYLRDRQRLDEATAGALLKAHREASDAIEKARAARALQRDALRDPHELMRDDGYRRPD